MTRVALILALLLLAACAAPLPPLPRPAPPGAEVQRVYVATQHGDFDRLSNFGADRQPVTRFLLADISVPPGHVPGQIETARRIDPKKHFSLVNSTEVTRQDFLAQIAQETSPSGLIAIFVHGYNVSILEAGLRVTQIQTDFELPFPMMAFAWPSSGDPRGYLYDRDSVLFARDGLEALIRQVRRQTGRKVVIVAHSMGTHLTMETLRQMAVRDDGKVTGLVDHVILVSPDIDPDVFRSQISRIDPLPQPFFVLSATQDRLLGLSGLLTGHRRRLGVLPAAPDLEARGVRFVDVTALGSGEGFQHTIPFSQPAAMVALARQLDAGE